MKDINTFREEWKINSRNIFNICDIESDDYFSKLVESLVENQDLKPDNVFLDIIKNRFDMPDDYPLTHFALLADFGLANAFSIFGHKYGSRPYMAPEQYDKKPDSLAKADVFAIGVILHELASGGHHPAGVRTHDIWPTPQEGQSKKWMRETPWKK